MAFPTVTETHGSDGAAASHAVTLPACNTGDLLIVVTRSDEVLVWTFEGSTTAFTQLQAPGAYHQQYAKYRVMTAGHSTTLTITGGNQAIVWSIMRIPAGSWSGTGSEIASASGSGVGNPDPPELTPAGGSKEYLWIIAATTVSDYQPAPPAGFTAFDAAANRMRVAYREYEGASLNPGSFDGFTWNAASTIAVPPAAPGGGRRTSTIAAIMS